MRLTALHRLSTLGHDLVRLCYPPSCQACGEGVQIEADHSNAANDIALADDRDHLLCSRCAAGLAKLRDEPYCDQCAMSLMEFGAPCAYCLGKGVPHFDQLLRVGLFRDPLRRLIHRAKYHRRWPLAEALADQLLLTPAHVAAIRSADAIVPVPLHPLRQIQRGYNQADLIARRLAWRTGRRVVPALARVRNTSTQTAMHSHSKRAENMRDAFEVVLPDQISGRHVLLVDDVMTTGATLQSIARTIAVHKPSRLTAAIISIADPRHQDFQAI